METFPRSTGPASAAISRPSRAEARSTGVRKTASAPFRPPGGEIAGTEEKKVEDARGQARIRSVPAASGSRFERAGIGGVSSSLPWEFDLQRRNFKSSLQQVRRSLNKN